MDGLDGNIIQGIILVTGVFIIILIVRFYFFYNRYRLCHPKEIFDDEIPLDEIRYCPNCGRKITIEMKSCPYCKRIIN